MTALQQRALPPSVLYGNNETSQTSLEKRSDFLTMLPETFFLLRISELTLVHFWQHEPKQESEIFMMFVNRHLSK